MELERHLGQERSTSSPCTTFSVYSWPHIMHRKVSIVVVAMFGLPGLPPDVVAPDSAGRQVTRGHAALQDDDQRERQQKENEALFHGEFSRQCYRGRDASTQVVVFRAGKPERLSLP
mgnify:CR=1 FL=1